MAGSSFATSQQQTQVQLFCLSIGSGVHLLLVLFTNDVLDLGFTGVCISTSLMFLARFLVVYFQIERIASLKNTNGVRLFSEESKVNLGH